MGNMENNYPLTRDPATATQLPAPKEQPCPKLKLETVLLVMVIPYM